LLFPDCFCGQKPLLGIVFLAGAWMSLVVDLGKMLEIKVCVHLRCGDVGMPKKLLDTSQIMA
jgi:hypothetical protein